MLEIGPDLKFVSLLWRLVPTVGSKPPASQQIHTTPPAIPRGPIFSEWCNTSWDQVSYWILQRITFKSADGFELSPCGSESKNLQNDFDSFFKIRKVKLWFVSVWKLWLNDRINDLQVKSHLFYRSVIKGQNFNLKRKICLLFELFDSICLD